MAHKSAILGLRNLSLLGGLAIISATILVPTRFLHYEVAAGGAMLLYGLVVAKSTHDRRPIQENEPCVPGFHHMMLLFLLLFLISLVLILKSVEVPSFEYHTTTWMAFAALVATILFYRVTLPRACLLLAGGFGLGFLLRVGAFVTAPGTQLLGSDIWYHYSQLVLFIERTGRIPVGPFYSFFPFWHVLTVESITLSGLSPQWSIYAGSGVLETATILPVFLATRSLFGIRTGLIASTLTAFLDGAVNYGSQISPISINFFFIALLVYILWIRDRRPWQLLAIGAIILTASILTHPYSTLLMLLLALIALIAGQVWNRLMAHPMGTPGRSARFSLLILVAVVGYWVFVGTIVTSFASSITEVLRRSETGALVQQYAAPAGEAFLLESGMALLLGLAVLGSLTTLAESPSHGQFTLISIAGALFLIVALTAPTGLAQYLLTSKWYPFLQLFLLVPASIVLVPRIRSHRPLRRFAVLAISIILAVLLTQSPWANPVGSIFVRQTPIPSPTLSLQNRASMLWMIERADGGVFYDDGRITFLIDGTNAIRSIILEMPLSSNQTILTDNIPGGALVFFDDSSLTRGTTRTIVSPFVGGEIPIRQNTILGPGVLVQLDGLGFTRAFDSGDCQIFVRAD